MRYLRLVKRYSSIIQGQFFGHLHSDSFRVVYNEVGKWSLWSFAYEKQQTQPFRGIVVPLGIDFCFSSVPLLSGKPVSWMMIAPSISPRRSSESNNPAMRLYKFDTDTGQVRQRTRATTSTNRHNLNINILRSTTNFVSYPRPLRQVLDYTQYYLDLEQANKLEEAVWQPEYNLIVLANTLRRVVKNLLRNNGSDA